MSMSMDWMAWVHEISQTALAGAVAILGLVMLLELRALARLRRHVDGHLSRLFEQLDLLRFDSHQISESHERRAAQPVPAPSAPAASAVTANAVAAAGTHAQQALGAGEARLLAALTAARQRIGRTERSATP